MAKCNKRDLKYIAITPLNQTLRKKKKKTMRGYPRRVKKIKLE
jgi:hypothetical protein